MMWRDLGLVLPRFTDVLSLKRSLSRSVVPQSTSLDGSVLEPGLRINVYLTHPNPRASE